MNHVKQYETWGDLFLPSYFGNQLGALAYCVVRGTLNNDCLDKANFFERGSGPQR
jgi:hypothetical protein